MPDHTAPPCHHDPEPHVIYDKAASGYRAQLRCRCRKLVLVSRRVRERVVEAEADGKAMLLSREQDIRRKHNARMAARQASVNPIPVMVVLIPPPLVVEPIPLLSAEAAWKAWWREVCARHGHASRL